MDAPMPPTCCRYTEHDDGSATRQGYIKIGCNPNATAPYSFTTIGDSNQAAFYEVDVIAPSPTQRPLTVGMTFQLLLNGSSGHTASPL